MSLFLDEELYRRMYELEHEINELNQKVGDLSIELNRKEIAQRNLLLRIKNREYISTDQILKGIPYSDLSPELAYKQYQNEDKDFIFLDVSEPSFKPFMEIPEARKIPYENLLMEAYLLSNKHTPILVISEQGVRSILACRLLVELGYVNVNNISGGHKFWPGYREEIRERKSA